MARPGRVGTSRRRRAVALRPDAGGQNLAGRAADSTHGGAGSSRAARARARGGGEDEEPGRARLPDPRGARFAAAGRAGRQLDGELARARLGGAGRRSEDRSGLRRVVEAHADSRRLVFRAGKRPWPRIPGAIGDRRGREASAGKTRGHGRTARGARCPHRRRAQAEARARCLGAALGADPVLLG